MNFVDFAGDTASLAGSLDARLGAFRAAGFAQVMLSADDFVNHAGGTADALRIVQASGLRVTGLGTLRDFEGLSGNLHEYKLDIAKGMLALCAQLGSRLLVVEASVSAHAAASTAQVVRDLRKLAILAIPFGIRIAYKSLPWSRTAHGYLMAHDIVYRAKCPNLGIAIDALHFFSPDAPGVEDIDTLEPERIMLVQLSDCMWHALRSTEEQVATATHSRVFPGEGVHTDTLTELVRRLDAVGYYGDWCLAVYNDDYRQLPAEIVAQRAAKSAVWVGETVLRRSLPVPNMQRLRAMK